MFSYRMRIALLVAAAAIVPCASAQQVSFERLRALGDSLTICTQGGMVSDYRNQPKSWVKLLANQIGCEMKLPLLEEMNAIGQQRRVDYPDYERVHCFAYNGVSVDDTFQKTADEISSLLFGWSWNHLPQRWDAFQHGACAHDLVHEIVRSQEAHHERGVVFGTGLQHRVARPGQTVTNEWGITYIWPEGQIGAFPNHDDAHRVLKDVTRWREVVKAPSVEFSDEQWAPAIEHAESVDRKDQFVTVFFASGTFEMTHNLMGMEDAMMNLYKQPQHMRDLIEYLTDYELRYAEQVIERLRPDALFHHDDWGGQISSFMSPAMFADFYLEPYKRAYRFWKDHGVELIVHHSDSYAANLVEHMIEMGIDIWQGVMTTKQHPRADQKIRRPDFIHGRAGQRSPGQPGLEPGTDRRACPESLQNLRQTLLYSLPDPGPERQLLPGRL